MLKNISLHIFDDEEAQASVEQRTSLFISERERANKNAFQRFMPTVYRQISSMRSEAISVVCTKSGQINIVNSATGRVFYGLDPESEVRSQVRDFGNHALKFSINADNVTPMNEAFFGVDSPLARKKGAGHTAPQDIDVLVVMGIGGGLHISELMTLHNIKQLIIYEPEQAYLTASLVMADWRQIFLEAQKKGTKIYLQLGKDGRDLAEDLTELGEVDPFQEFFVYKHYNHPVFDEVVALLCEHNWQQFRGKVVRQFQITSFNNFLPEWTIPLDSARWHVCNLDSSRFQRNISALNKYFPALYKEFIEYTPVSWQPVGDVKGVVNIVHKATLSAHYGNEPLADSRIHEEAFARHPNRDGLVLGYKGNKLKKYLHYEMVAQVEEVLKGIEETKGVLPQTIKSMISFGIGAGYELASLATEHRIEKLFICEPNRDFFFASLYAIDWATLLQEIDEQKARIYINVGDDGSHLIEDLLTQFHSVGPYILANTYFLQGYYNALLVSAVAQLREQLQVIISMGDYFDHSRYCISHTRWGMENRIPLLKRDAAQHLTAEERDVPVFIIGNGPSLDNLIDVIKENADRAILVSCGTALKALYHHGITPDYHTEIESNRATFDWNVRVGNLDYLKKIILLSCNGIHPDTAGLFKSTLIALKEGESATVSFTEVFGQGRYASLKYAYPTVTNFAANIVAELGFSQIYLCGVDLGFVDDSHHHSRRSGYYHVDGKPHYDYSKRNDTSILIEGNLRPFVRTKYEFKVAKKVLEQPLRLISEVYNLNDGVKILYALPLQKDNVLVLSNGLSKRSAMESVKQRCFVTIEPQDYQEQHNRRFKHVSLLAEIEALVELVKRPVESLEEAESLIDTQRTLLVDSYLKKRSLLFFYLNGTLNFINSAMMKAISIDADKGALKAFQRLQEIWTDALTQIELVLRKDEKSFCFISNFEGERRKVMIQNAHLRSPFTIKATPPEKQKFVDDMLNWYSLADRPSEAAICLNWSDTVSSCEGDVLIAPELGNALEVAKRGLKARVFCLPGNWNEKRNSPVSQDVHRASSAFICESGVEKFHFFIGKLIVENEQEVELYYDISRFSDYIAYECGDNVIGFTMTYLNGDEALLIDGTRARLIPRKLRLSDFIISLSPEHNVEAMREFFVKSFTSLAVE